MVEFDFMMFFGLAQAEALSEREQRIVGLRYGLLSGDPLTLEQIAQQIGVTRERIRQLLNKSVRKLRSRANWQIKKGYLDHICARLCLYVSQTIRPHEPGAADRAFAFVNEHLGFLPLKTHAYPIVVAFGGATGLDKKAFLDEIVNKERAYRFAERREKRKRRESERFVKWLEAKAVWPRLLRRIGQLEAKGRSRNVKMDGESYAGSFFSEKMKREVQYESSLECRFLIALEETVDVVCYQEQPFALDYEFDGEKRVYYPDALFVLKDGRGVVVEIKPVQQMALNVNLTKFSALSDYCHYSGLGMLVTDGRRSIEDIRRRVVPQPFSIALISAITEHPLTWREYEPIREKYGATFSDFVATVLQHDLVWSLTPFMLAKRRTYP